MVCFGVCCFVDFEGTADNEPDWVLVIWVLVIAVLSIALPLRSVLWSQVVDGYVCSCCVS